MARHAHRSHRSDYSAKNERGEYETFEGALKKVLSVPHSEMRAKLDAEKKHRKASSRASSEKA